MSFEPMRACHTYELLCPSASTTMCIYRDEPILPSDAVHSLAWALWEESPSKARDLFAEGLRVFVQPHRLQFDIRNNPAWLSGSRGYDRPFVIEAAAHIESEEM